jgi:hypothetical protein
MLPGKIGFINASKINTFAFSQQTKNMYNLSDRSQYIEKRVKLAKWMKNPTSQV